MMPLTPLRVNRTRNIVVPYFGCSAAFRGGACRAKARRYVRD
jgi:hypothetical protein